MAPLRSRLRETENKNSTQTATFLRLAIVASSPIVNRGTKTQVICRVKAPFRFAGTGKSSQSQKSCRDAEIFVFTMGGLSQQVDFAMGGLPQRGKSRRCAYSRRQRGRQHLGLLIGRGGPWVLPGRVGRQPVRRGVCCGLDGAAAPRS